MFEHNIWLMYEYSVSDDYHVLVNNSINYKTNRKNTGYQLDTNWIETESIPIHRANTLSIDMYIALSCNIHVHTALHVCWIWNQSAD